jgi:hypothetical protein
MELDNNNTHTKKEMGRWIEQGIFKGRGTNGQQIHE